MKSQDSKILTAKLERAALVLLRFNIYRKPDDLARRFGLPLPVPRYWWRINDHDLSVEEQQMSEAKRAKLIRKATQSLEAWEKIKRYRPQCGARLNSGKLCKNPVAIRAPEAWADGCLGDRCRVHGGHARNIKKKKDNLD